MSLAVLSQCQTQQDGSVLEWKRIYLKGDCVRKEPILTALDADGQLVRIDDADRGKRYMGATQDHEDCELYPVFRSTKQSSFALLPSQVHVAAHRRGQSAAHRRACTDWYDLLQRSCWAIAGCAS